MRSESDEMLANEIAKRVRQYVFYTIYDDVEGSVHDGLVTLTGQDVLSGRRASLRT